MHRQLEVLVVLLTFTPHIGSRYTSALFSKIARVPPLVPKGERALLGASDKNDTKVPQAIAPQ